MDDAATVFMEAWLRSLGWEPLVWSDGIRWSKPGYSAYTFDEVVNMEGRKLGMPPWAPPVAPPVVPPS